MTRALYAYAFLCDFVLLYPVYAVLFAETGLSTAEISTLFALWSVTGFVLEIPSGVWADAVSRRLLLVVAPLLAGAGFGLWTVAPSLPAFAAGFVLWGVSGALQSGALEALVYEELEREGQASRYAEVMGRATALGTVAATLAIGLAAPVLALGGFGAVGAASVIACVAAAAAAAALPEHRDGDDGHGGFAAYAAIVRAGWSTVRAQPAVRHALLAVAAVSAVWGSLDEYVPLLAADTGAGREGVALLVLLVYAGATAGGALAGRAARLSRGALAGVLAGSATALALGALSGVPAGFVLVAAAFCGFQAVTIVVDAQLQDAITGTARSTVTSLAGLATEILVLAVFAGYAAGSAIASHAVLFACFAAVYPPLALAYGRRRRATRAG